MKIQIFTNHLRLFFATLLAVCTMSLFAQGGQTCGTAVAVTPGTINADGPTAGGGAEGPCFPASTNAEWYSFTPASDGSINVFSCNSTLDPGDTRLSILTGTCGSLVCEEGDDDDCNAPNGLASDIQDLIVSSGVTYFIQWDDRWNDDPFDWELEFTAGIIQPTGVMVTGVTEDEIMLSWSGDPAETYTIEYGPAPLTAGMGTTIMVMGNSATITGLMSGTAYGIIVSNANATIGTETTLSASTTLAALVCSNPSNMLSTISEENFDNPPTYGLSSSNSEFTAGWFTGTETGSGGTGPANATSEFLYFETSGAGGAAPIILDIPGTINLTAASEARITFGIHAVWTFGTPNSVELQASTDGGTTFTTIYTKNLDSAADNLPADDEDDFVPQEVDLAPFVGNTVTLRWAGFDTGSGFNDIAIDNFAVEACLSCVGASGPTLTGPTAPIMVGADPDICGAMVTIPTVTAMDDCPDLGAVTNDFDNGTGDVTGEFPVGTTVVTYSATDSEGNVGTLEVTVEVVDDVDPTFTSCPSSQVFNLAGGGCSQVVDFMVTAEDNCTIAPGSLQGITDGGNGGAVGGVVYFNITNNTTADIEITSFDMNITANTLVDVYTSATYVGNEGTAGAWTLATQFDATSGAVSGAFPGNGTLTPAVGSLMIPPGVTGIALRALTAAHNYTNGNGANEQFSNADLTVDLGSASNGLFGGGIFTPRVFNGGINYNLDLDPTIVQLAGLPSGSEFPIGTTTNIFEATDFAGNTVQCTFDITVNEFVPSGGGQITVNPTVQTSLDPNSTCTLVGADEILEGNNYGCYDNFIFTRTPAVAPGFGCPSGPTFLGAVPVTCADIGRPVRIVITDPNTGNSQWSTIIVEDKTAPTLVGCEDVTLTCNGIVSTDFEVLPGLQIINTNTPTEATITVPGSFAGNLITDLDVEIDISHTWIGDLTITLTSPQGTEITFFNQGCGNFDDFVITFDDEDPFCIGDDPDQCNTIGSGVSSQTLNCVAPGAFDPLSIFDGEDPAGDWIFSVTDGVGGDEGVLNRVSLNFNFTNQVDINSLVTVQDNCPNASLTFSDSEIPGNCATDRQVVRTYVATDASGNTATCSQTLTFELPELDDIDPITNFDGIDGPMLDCSSGYPDIGAPVTLTLNTIVLPGVNPVDNGVVRVPITLSGYPADATFADLDISLNLEWSTVGDLVIDFGRDNGSVPTRLFANQCDRENDILATFDDQGFAQINCADFEPTVKGTFQPVGSLADFNGTRVNGNYVLIVEDINAGFDVGTINDITLSVTYTTSSLITPPTINGQPFDQLDCQINVTYEDRVIDVCPTSYKVRRQWTIIDMCNGDDEVINQILTVMDQDAPILECPRSDVDNPITLVALSNQRYQNTQSNYGQCLGDITVPSVAVLADNCSGVQSFSTEIYSADGTQLGSVATNGGTFLELPLSDGVFTDPRDEPSILYRVRYIVKDNCGNQDAVEVFYNVVERTAPIADCDEITNVSLTGTDTTWIPVNVFDDGSYDICGDVHFYGRRMLETNDDVPYGNYFESENLTRFVPFKFSDRIPFTCADETVMVYFLVLDDYAQGYVDFMVNDFIPNLPASIRNNPNTPYTVMPDGDLYLSTANSITGRTKDLWEGHYNLCMVEVMVEDKVAPIKLVDAPNRVISCTDDQLRQQYLDDTNLEFDAPIFADNCDFTVSLTVIDGTATCGDGVIRRRFQATDDAGNVSVLCEQRITSVLEHDYTIIWPRDEDRNMCTSGVLGDTLSRPGSLIEDGCDLLAVSYEDQRFSTQDDACYKILRTYDVINWCEWDGSSPAVQIGNPTNTTAGPRLDVVVDAAGTQDIRINFVPQNITSVGRWSYIQQIKVYDEEDPTLTNINQAPCEAGNVVSDLPNFGCGQTVSVDFDLTDNCGGLRTPTYRLVAFVDDANGDGVISATELAAGTSFPNDPFNGTLSTPAGSTPAAAASGTYNISGTYPLGTHVFVVTAIDLCGNAATYNVPFTAEDCKEPTPYGLSFITIDLMATGMVDVWASDIDNGSFDGCGPVKLSFSANVNDTGRTFTCADLGTTPVQLWVTDAAGNQDFIDVNVIIQDNLGACGGSSPRIAASLTTATGYGVEGAAVNVSGDATMSNITDINGATTIDVALNGDYTVSALLNSNPTNGVTTYDLYLIGQDILGISPLTTFSERVAADANANGSISAFDMTVIRRVILGLDQEFRGNTSWKFFNANNTASEVVNFNDVAGQVAADFVAVKIGDVNGDASANSRQALAPRTLVGEFALEAKDAVLSAGETQIVSFNANDVNVLGYQLTLEWDANALEVVRVIGGAHSEANFGKHLLSEGKLTMSHNGSMEGELFSLEVRALRDGVALSEVMNAGNSVTAAEAYVAEGNKSVTVRFGGATASTGNALEQNRPNPFSGTTTIGFTLAEAGQASLMITDVTGRVVWQTSGNFDAGSTTLEISSDELPASGLLNYTLTAGDFTATRKMVVIK